MDKDVRNAIERATQQARKLLEEEFAAQLEGDFDVHRDGAVAATAGGHLSARQAIQRERIVAAIEHKRAAGMGAIEATLDYLRDAAFTTLNRYVALKMLEARDLVQECITKGEQSAGYREFCGLAPGLPLLPNSAGYRLYIESLFDELSTEVKVLFDRREPSSVLWPRRATFEQLLEILNAADLAQVWGEDETIGWVYQFFNGSDERRAMREESAAPRNSRELAIRNQFFTPRYVVQFLTDNTLGRIWYEMRRAKTALAERCDHMVRKLGEELTPRAKKDPRDLRVLDPACGSGHFLLYAFDLLLAIYDEAYSDPECPKSESTGKSLADDYPSLDALRKAIPGLVLAHNLHGVDIDPRCAQIAQLALWMRAQKAYRDFGISRAERNQIRRSNIVIAEPLVADEEIAKEFVARLGDVELGRLFMSLVGALKHAGDLGILLRIEQIAGTRAHKQGDLFAPPEDRIRAALNQFVVDANTGMNPRRRLFVDDAAHGVALLSVAEKRYDVVLMNPPFGLPVSRTAAYLRANDGGHTEIGGAFVLRANELCRNGMVGFIITSAVLTRRRLERLRRNAIVPRLSLCANLGQGVMDSAQVDAAVFVLSSTPHDTFLAMQATKGQDLSARLCSKDAWHDERKSELNSLAQIQVGNMQTRKIGDSVLFEPTLGTAREGMKTFSDERFLRAWWEVNPETVKTGSWRFYSKGTRGSYCGDPYLVLRWGVSGEELKAVNLSINGSSAQVMQASRFWGRPGLTYTRRSKRFSPKTLPAGCVLSDMSPAILVDADDKDDIYGFLALLGSDHVSRSVAAVCNANNFTTGAVKRLEIDRKNLSSLSELSILGRSLVDLDRSVRELDETSVFFRPTALLTSETRSVDAQELLNRVEDVVSMERGEGLRQTDNAAAPLSSAVKKHTHELALVSFLVGVVFGRWSLEALIVHTTREDPLSVVQVPTAVHVRDGVSGPGVLDSHDLAREVWKCATNLSGIAPNLDGRGLLDDAGAIATLLIDPSGFWDAHRRDYSQGARSAPIFWQLATPSACYSVWLYIHAFSKDTLFRVQNDHVALKLAQEERRLESLTRELRNGATAAQRMQLAGQEALVEELCAFLDEVKRVAPLWNPNLDDGVLINFAPLWRLVPQNRSWQKELKSTWDALGEGTCDWAHLAMHLWPERVVPKCADDRSLAVAHGLEDVFWIEGADGKWAARNAPTHNVDELVRGRTSAAVKSALKKLFEAPATGGKHDGSYRKSSAAVERGDA